MGQARSLPPPPQDYQIFLRSHSACLVCSVQNLGYQLKTHLKILNLVACKH